MTFFEVATPVLPPAHAAAPPAGGADAFPSVADVLAGSVGDGGGDETDAVGTATSAPIATAAPTALLILGRDEHDRPHASRFEGCDAGAVAAAAGLMNMVALPVTSRPLAVLAAKLPEGRLFASGKAFVPFVSGPLFLKLVSYTPVADRAALEPGAQRRAAQAAKGGKAKSDTDEGDGPAGAPVPGTPAPSPTPDEPATPTPPDAPVDAAPSGELIPGKPIKPGTFPAGWDAIRPLMIVLATLEGFDSWWPAEVTESKGEGLFVLKWVDGDDDHFLRRTEQLALLHPNYRGMGEKS